MLPQPAIMQRQGFVQQHASINPAVCTHQVTHVQTGCVLSLLSMQYCWNLYICMHLVRIHQVKLQVDSLP